MSERISNTQGTTYSLYPNDENQIGNSPFTKTKSSFYRLPKFTFLCWCCIYIFLFFVGNYDSMGYMLFIFGIIIFCELMT